MSLKDNFSLDTPATPGVALGSNATIDLMSSTNEILSISALYERTDILHKKLQLQS